jgi:pimeloyl-ACP methyl ester carboxylesterase
LAGARRRHRGIQALRSLILVHGAGNGPWVFDGWDAAFPGVEVEAVDLHAGLNVGEAAMSNYAAVVVRAADLLRRPVGLCGWSMGGLVAMLAARQARAERLVLIEPSPPGEVQGFHDGIPLETGTFDPEAEYGDFPPGMRARPESRLARSERKRGIAVPSLACPALVVYGDEFVEARGKAVAGVYSSAELYMHGLDHWGLVRDARVARAVAAWLAGKRAPSLTECEERPGPGGAGMTSNSD